jgi:hypothetical protein
MIESFFLHADVDDKRNVWSVSSKGFTTKVLLEKLDTVFAKGRFRVLGLPENYQLITTAYSRFLFKNAPVKLFVGSPLLCKYAACDPVSLLSRLATISAHDNATNMWHELRTEEYSTYVLLRQYLSEGVSESVCNLYRQHAISRVFRFLELDDLPLVLQVISQVVDPRWFVNVKNPTRTSRLENHFGLKLKHSTDKRITDRQDRASLLVSLVSNLDASHWIWKEITVCSDPEKATMKACKLLLSFVFRNWLSLLTAQPHFNPILFFKDPITRNRYVQSKVLE